MSRSRFFILVLFAAALLGIGAVWIARKQPDANRVRSTAAPVKPAVSGSVLTPDSGPGSPEDSKATFVAKQAKVLVQEPGASTGSVLTTNQAAQSVPDREIFASKWGQGGKAELDAFAKWADAYVAASPQVRETMLARGIALAVARRAVLLDLIKNDPREALANAAPVAVARQMPSEVEVSLEKRVSGVGNVGLVFGMSQPGSSTPVPTNDLATVNGQHYFAHRYGARAIRNGYKDVSIHGVAIDDQLAVSSSPVKVLEKGESYTDLKADCEVTDNKQILAPGDEPDQKTTVLFGTHASLMCCPYCVQTFDEQKTSEEGTTTAPQGLSDSGIPGTMGFPGKPPTWLTMGGKGVIYLRVQPADAVALGQGFPGWADNNYFQNMTYNDGDNWNARVVRTSYGKVWISRADATPVLTLPQNTAYYTGPGYYWWGRWTDDAKAAATAAGYNMSNYSTFCVCHTGYDNGLGAAGWGATDGSGNIWSNGAFSVHLFDHEGGHTYGLPHANSWTSTDGNPLSNSRGHVEYGDVADPMGNAWGSGLLNDYNVYYKSFCSWLPDNTVLSVTHSGTYRIRQFDNGTILTNSPLALKISRDSDMDLWVSYRGSPIAQGNFNTGASVLGVAAGRISDSHIVDMNNPAGDTADAPLAQGQKFTDSASGISLTTAGRGGVNGDRYMYVKVDFPAGYTGGKRTLVNGGIYCLRNVSFNKYLELPFNDAAAGASVQLWDFNGSPAQQWVAWRNDDGSYSFNHYGTDKWLDALNNGGGNYTNIIQWTRNGGDSQRWDVLILGNGYMKLRHRNTNQVISADIGNNGDIITYDDLSNPDQQWEPVLVGMTEGSYRLTPRHAQSLGIGVRNHATYANAQVEEQTWDGGAWQRWTMQSLGSGQFRIFPQGQTSMALTVSGASTANGAKAVLMPWTNTAEQKWTFTSTGGGFVRLTPLHAPNQCLDVIAGSTAAGADVQSWQYLGGANQQWQFTDPDL